MSRRLAAPALLFALCYSLSTLDAGAQLPAQKSSPRTPSEPGAVSLRLKISVVEAETGRPVPKAQVAIQRAGRGPRGVSVADIVGMTDDAGDLDAGDTEFWLGGEPHRMEVGAPGYEVLKLELPDSVLRESAGSERSLEMSVALSKNVPPPATTQAARPTEAKANSAGDNVRQVSAEPRGFFANAVSLFLLISNKALWWLGLAAVVALVAYGVARSMGYDIDSGRGGDPGPDRTQSYLRLIEVRLKELQQSIQRSASASAPRGDVGGDEHFERMVMLLKRLEDLTSSTNVPAAAPDDASYHRTKESLSRLENQFTVKLGRLSDAVKEIHGLVSTLLVEARWVQDGDASHSARGVSREPERESARRPAEKRGADGQGQIQEDESIKRLFKDAFRELYGEPVPRTPDKPPVFRPAASPATQGGWPLAGGNDGAANPLTLPSEHRLTSHVERARAAYKGLLNDQPISPEPLHLDAEEPTILRKLEDSSVYLMQVGHMQGTFVLFTEDGKAGYVYPNPALAFQGPALREVFPGLTEAEFNGAKQRIEPVPVTRVGDRRWKVGRSILEL